MENNQKAKWWKYGKENMDRAAEEVSRGVPLLTAARNNGVPRSSLRRYIKGGGEKFKKMGRSPVLTKEEEETLVLWIVSVAQAGFPVSKENLLDSVQKLLKDMGRENNFSDSRPGRSWFESFLKRNPNIATRVAQNLTVTRASVTAQCLRNWFSEVNDYLKENNLERILEEPRRVFNADETAFFFNPKGNKVLALKGSKNIHQQVSANEKECITVLICANADGQLGPPLVVFKYERIPQELVNSVPHDWGLGKSETGWMNGMLFYEYLANVFHPWLIKNEISRPVILFVDGHSSHLTLHTSRFCNDKGIILIALYANATHIIQPMDVAVFRSLKENYKHKVHNWRLKNEGNSTMKKKDFCPLLKDILDEVSPLIIQNGFRKCGLVPWDPSAPIANMSKPSTSCVPPSHPPYQHKEKELKAAFATLENYIGSEKIGLFQQSHSNWTGCEEDRSLFQVWHTMKCDVLKYEVPPLSGEIISTGEIEDQYTFSVTDAEANPCNSSDTSSLNTSNNLQGAAPSEETNNHNNSYDIDIQPGVDKSKIPSPFKRTLYWPVQHPNVNSKRKRREFVPSVVTSEKWREHNENKEKKKVELQKQKEERKLERQRKKEEKEAMMKQKAEERKLKTSAPKKRTTKKSREKVVIVSSEDESWNPSGNSSDDISIGTGEGYDDLSEEPATS